MKKRIVQISRHSVCYFFMLTSIGCSKLSDQLGVETKAHTSAVAVRNKSVKRSVNAQMNSEVVGIPKIKTLLTVMMILSQVQPAVGNGDTAFCSNLRRWKNKYTAFLYRRSDVSSFFDDFYAFYCDAICEEYAHCISRIETINLNYDHISQKKTQIENKRIELDRLKKQPRDAQNEQEGELRKLRADRNRLLGIFSTTSDMPTPLPLHSRSSYSNAYSKNGQAHFHGNYVRCAYIICNNQCDHNGESHRGRREVIDINRVTRNSQKAESKVYAKRPTQGKSYRENPFFSNNQSHR